MWASNAATRDIPGMQQNVANGHLAPPTGDQDNDRNPLTPCEAGLAMSGPLSKAHRLRHADEHASAALQ